MTSYNQHVPLGAQPPAYTNVVTYADTRTSDPTQPPLSNGSAAGASYPPPTAPAGGFVSYERKPVSGQIRPSDKTVTAQHRIVGVGFDSGGSPGIKGTDWDFTGELAWFGPNSTPGRIVLAWAPVAPPSGSSSDAVDAVADAVDAPGSEGAGGSEGLLSDPTVYVNPTPEPEAPRSGSSAGLVLLVLGGGLALYFASRRGRRRT